MPIDPKQITSILCTDTASFNLVHFKDVNHPQGVNAHYWVTISLGDNKYMLISIITSQMQKLERVYRFKGQKQAIDCLVPVSKLELPVLDRGCVVNCNETLLLTEDELLHKVDLKYKSNSTSNCIDLIHGDYEFENEFKRKIIQAIENSPLVKGEVKRSLQLIKETMQIAA